MELKFLKNLLSEGQISGICFTLLHSLWIGLIIAALAALVMAITTRASAALRYRFFCTLLFLFVLGVAIAAIYELGDVKQGELARVKNQGLQEVSIQSSQIIALSEPSFIDRATLFFNQHASWILGIWVLLFAIKAIKLAVGVLYLQRIRTFKVQQIEAEWAVKVDHFARKMGIGKKVKVIQSALVKVPVTLGYFKPVIVVPIGLLFSLPVAQVETILWHELAHIYRRDYLVNILQKFIEALFFFNPAILWLSAVIREEREACCDDIVLSHIEQKTNYLAALVSFHNQKQEVGNLAMGLSLRPNQLMNRLRRMVNQENKRLSITELVILVLGFGLLTAFTSIPQVDTSIKKGVVYMKEVIVETFVVDANVVKPDKNNLKMSIRTDKVVANKSDSLVADTPIIIKSMKFNNSNDDRANRDMTIIDGRDNTYHIIVSSGKITAVSLNGKAITPNGFKNYERLVTQVDKAIKNKGLSKNAQVDPNLQRKKEHLSLGFVQVNKNAGRDSTNMGTQVVTVPIDKILDKRVIGSQVVKKVPLVDASSDRDRVMGVINALVQQKIVVDVYAVEWFALTEEQLVVNGQKQSVELHQNLKKKYNIRTDYGLFFGPTKIHGTGIIFDKKDL